MTYKDYQIEKDQPILASWIITQRLTKEI